MTSLILICPVLLPILSALCLYLQPLRKSGVGKTVIFAAVLLTSALTGIIVLNCDGMEFQLFRFTQDLTITFRVDKLCSYFLALIAVLWPITTLYAFEYMKGEKEFPASFYSFFLMSYGVTVGIALSANMLTMYCFYEMLTLSTLPLIMHGGKRKGMRASRIYLAFSIGGAAFAFMGMVYLLANGFTLDFSVSEIVSAASVTNKNLYLLIYVFSFVGFGVKAAIFPLHAWLPKASVAPTPVTALLHAVAVVKAGAFAIIRLTYGAYGATFIKDTWAQYLVIALVAFTIVYGSVMALKETHFKRRLAYSTVANMSYILFGVVLMTPEGLSAGLMHMGAHAIIKILAFFCAGAVLHKAGREYVSELNGLGKRMPITFICFTVSALALSGIPPMNGFTSKWSLLTAATENGGAMSYIGAAALLISAMLTAVYMFSCVIRAWFMPPDEKLRLATGKMEANAYMTVPMILLAAACVLIGIFGVPMEDLVQSIAATMFS